jgi:hypothetical protein
MPTKHVWVPPEVALRTPQGTIYHAYKDDDAERPLTYWYTTDENEDDAYEFDIRELPLYLAVSQKTSENHARILRRAAARGEIEFPKGSRG